MPFNRGTRRLRWRELVLLMPPFRLTSRAFFIPTKQRWKNHRDDQSMVCLGGIRKLTSALALVACGLYLSFKTFTGSSESHLIGRMLCNLPVEPISCGNQSVCGEKSGTFLFFCCPQTLSGDLPK